MRRVLVVIAWAAATLASGAIAWAVVGLAGDQVLDEPVVPLSADQVATLVTTPAGDQVPPTAPPPSAATIPPTAEGDVVSEPDSDPTTAEAGSKETTVTTTAVTPATIVTTTVAPASAGEGTSTTAASEPAETATTVATQEPEVAAYRVPGGTVVVRHTSEWVELVSATPDQGYGVDVEDSGPDRVEVEFEGSGGEATFKAEIRDGRLVTDVDSEG